MRRNQALALVFVVAAAFTGCATADNANHATTNSNATASPQRDGLVTTNANIPQNSNSATVPSNTGVVTNDNGNANTAGVREINSNNRNANTTKKP